jgi:filamentous hemagglutinin
MDLYSYCGGDPVNNFDPDGRCFENVKQDSAYGYDTASNIGLSIVVTALDGGALVDNFFHYGGPITQLDESSFGQMAAILNNSDRSPLERRGYYRNSALSRAVQNTAVMVAPIFLGNPESALARESVVGSSTIAPIETTQETLLLEDARTSLQLRNSLGLAHGRDLPVINSGEQWLRGTSANAGRVPGQIADRLAGRSFASFDEFRQAFWDEVAHDPVLSQQFGPNSLREMQAGRAPFAPPSEQVGGRIKYEIDHMTEIQYGGNVYDMNNLIIRTPVSHIGK